MTIPHTVPPPIPRRRPALVWVISIFYLFSVGGTLLSFALLASGVLPLSEAQKTYFQSQTTLDYGITLLISLSNLTGAVMLFLLRRHALYCFAGAFIVGLLFTGYQIMAKNWLGAIGGLGLVGALFGWSINLAVILYTRSLVVRQVLR